MDAKLKEDLEKQLVELNSQLTGNMMQDMEIKDKIHNLEMVINGTKPTDSQVDCINCGS